MFSVVGKTVIGLSKRLEMRLTMIFQKMRVTAENIHWLDPMKWDLEHTPPAGPNVIGRCDWENVVPQIAWPHAT